MCRSAGEQVRQLSRNPAATNEAGHLHYGGGPSFAFLHAHNGLPGYERTGKRLCC